MKKQVAEIKGLLLEQKELQTFAVMAENIYYFLEDLKIREPNRFAEMSAVDMSILRGVGHVLTLWNTGNTATSQGLRPFAEGP